MTDIFRIGQGIDVHAFAPGAHGTLHLACLEWPDSPLLEGHSDGDVAAHAACDALLAAANLGDLGTVFGTDDPRWEGASGTSMLQEVRRLLDEAGWEIGNVSVQVVGQKPRLSGRMKEAQGAMSAALGGVDLSFGATTTDRLGFLGREEGLAALAVAMVSRPSAPR